jgi:CDGSH-type Zn-finger protein/uncharacterized Fe-S cluster protein YjdI
MAYMIDDPMPRDPRDAMSEKLHLYHGTAIDVTYDKKRCIHVSDCIRGLPRVFDPGSRPWVIVGNSTADKIAAVVEQCPSGALHYTRKDGGAAEVPDAENALRVSRNGPLFIRGQLELVEPDGTVMPETRLTLCRCGASTHKPYCDNSHLRVRFEDPSTRIPAGELDPDRADASGPLRIEPQPNGPVQFTGNLRVLDAAGVAAGCATEATFCRCGHSANKPFCDGSHDRAGFSST